MRVCSLFGRFDIFIDAARHFVVAVAYNIMLLNAWRPQYDIFHQKIVAKVCKKNLQLHFFRLHPSKPTPVKFAIPKSLGPFGELNIMLYRRPERKFYIIKVNFTIEYKIKIH